MRTGCGGSFALSISIATMLMTRIQIGQSRRSGSLESLAWLPKEMTLMHWPSCNRIIVLLETLFIMKYLFLCKMVSNWRFKNPKTACNERVCCCCLKTRLITIQHEVNLLVCSVVISTQWFKDPKRVCREGTATFNILPQLLSLFGRS